MFNVSGVGSSHQPFPQDHPQQPTSSDAAGAGPSSPPNVPHGLQRAYSAKLLPMFNPMHIHGSVMQAVKDYREMPHAARLPLESQFQPGSAALAKSAAMRHGSRQVFAPTPISHLHVLDWDDMIRDKSRGDYQLLHNAIAVAADRYAEQYPCLRGLAQMMIDHTGTYVDGMPWLCMDEDTFSKTVMQDVVITKREVIVNLLQSVSAINPALAADIATAESTPARLYVPYSVHAAAIANPLLAHIHAEQQKHRETTRGSQCIENILDAEFHRQYAQLIRAAAVPSSKSAVRHHLPFPDITIAMMPGAAALLNTLRKPEHFMALFSNRGDGALEAELNKAGFHYYFDVASGAHEMTVADAAGNVAVRHVDKKPGDVRLRALVEAYPRLAKSQVTLWGDKTKDLTQVIPLVTDGTLAPDQVHGMLVNPHPEIQVKAQQLMAAAGIMDVQGMPRLYA